MPEPETPTPAAAPAEQDNSTIRAMRAEVETAKRAARDAAEKAAAYEAQLQELERARLDETDRLQAELDHARRAAAEGDALRDEHGVFVSVFERLYTEALEQVPEAARERVGRLTGSGSWAERYERLRDALALAGAAAPATAAGSHTNPPLGGAPAAESGAHRPVPATDLRRLTWGQALPRMGRANGV